MTRRVNDNYPTEEVLVEALLSRTFIGGVGKLAILEPCAGAGQIVNALKRHNGRWAITSNDIVHQIVRQKCSACISGIEYGIGPQLPEPLELTCKKCGTVQTVHDDRTIQVYECNHYLDATDKSNWKRFGNFHDGVITNPPFNQLVPILDNALCYSKRFVAMLLRITALEPANRKIRRGALLNRHKDCLRNLIVFGSPRPSYSADGKTDSVTTAWFVWDFEWSWKKLGVDPPFDFVMGWK